MWPNQRVSSATRSVAPKRGLPPVTAVPIQCLDRAQHLSHDKDSRSHQSAPSKNSPPRTGGSCLNYPLSTLQRLAEAGNRTAPYTTAQHTQIETCQPVGTAA